MGTTSEFRSISYDCYSKLIKKAPYLKDQTEMLFRLIKDHHRIISERERSVPFVSDGVNNWIEDTWSKHRVNLVAFARAWVNRFFDNPDIWPTTHKIRSQERWMPWNYDYKQKSNLFNLDSLYAKMPKKSFIRGRKQEFEVLMMYLWLHEIDSDDDNYWEEYATRVVPAIDIK